MRNHVSAIISTAVCLLLSQSLLAQTPPGERPSAQFAQANKAEFDHGEFEPKYPSESRWLDGGDRYTVLEPSTVNADASDIVAYETASGKRSVLVTAKQLIPAGAKDSLSIDDYAWSADNKQLLIFTNAQKVWRQRTRGDYWVLRLADGRLTRLGANAPATSLMFAKFSPNGASVAYVRANNIYIESLATNEVRPLTTDGSYDIINGTTDWVTEEEFELRDAFRWSPDSQSIAYWQFDQSGVSEYTLINDTAAKYPTTFHYKYPHPGDTNSAVRVGVVSAKGGSTQWIKLPGDPRNNYIPRMEWIGDSNQIALQYLNRQQNADQVWIADARSGEARQIFEDKDAAWVDVMDQFQWLNKDKAGKPQDFLWLSERDGWRHAYLVPRATGQPRLITNFPADVIAPVNIANGYLYFTASPSNPTQSYLYRSRLDGKGRPERVTPEDQPGTHGYVVSPNGKWAMHNFSSATHPPRFDLVQMSSQKVQRTLVTNDDLVAKDSAIDPLAPELFETSIGGGITLSTSIVKPPGFDPNKKYPVLVNVYGEPFMTMVTDTWNYTFAKTIAREGYIVMSFDNQGTPAPRGRAWRKCIYGSIGVLSSQQQTAAIEAFAKSHPYVDTTRMGIWGHSGGGSATLNEMFRYPGVFQAGVAIAPMADQALYDSIYQERYMGTPQNNPKGYHDGSPINYAEGLTGHLLIIHGSGDDNVHFQATELLVDKLIELGKPFDFMDYPNRTHDISEGPGTMYHRFMLLLRFLEEYVPPGPARQ